MCRRSLAPPSPMSMTPATALSHVGGATRPASLATQHGGADRHRVADVDGTQGAPDGLATPSCMPERHREQPAHGRVEAMEGAEPGDASS